MSEFETDEPMSEVFHILKRGDGRTIYQSGERLMVRFDSEEDGERFEAACRLLDCVDCEDRANHLRSVGGGLIADEDDLLKYVDDDEAREIIRLEVAPMIEAAVSALVA